MQILRTFILFAQVFFLLNAATLAHAGSDDLPFPCGQNIEVKRWENAAGVLGGWVSVDSEVEFGAYIHPSSKICENSKVGKDVYIGSNVEIWNTQIEGFLDLHKNIIVENSYLKSHRVPGFSTLQGEPWIVIQNSRIEWSEPEKHHFNGHIYIQKSIVRDSGLKGSIHLWMAQLKNSFLGNSKSHRTDPFGNIHLLKDHKSKTKAWIKVANASIDQVALVANRLLIADDSHLTKGDYLWNDRSKRNQVKRIVLVHKNLNGKDLVKDPEPSDQTLKDPVKKNHRKLTSLIRHLVDLHKASLRISSPPETTISWGALPLEISYYIFRYLDPMTLQDWGRTSLVDYHHVRHFNLNSSETRNTLGQFQLPTLTQTYKKVLKMTFLSDEDFWNILFSIYLKYPGALYTFLQEGSQGVWD